MIKKGMWVLYGRKVYKVECDETKFVAGTTYPNPVVKLDGLSGCYWAADMKPINFVEVWWRKGEAYTRQNWRSLAVYVVVILTVVLLVDHFCFKGRFRQRLQKVCTWRK